MEILNQIQQKIKNSFSSAASVPQISEESVRQALKVVQDPDLHRDIVSLGFVTKVTIEGSHVAATIRLTTPACPVKEQLKQQSEEAIQKIPGVEKVTITMTAETRGAHARHHHGGPDKTSPTLTASLGQVKNIIAVASGKGGVGKSTSTVNLAFALAESGAKVGILDADVYGPSLALMTRAKTSENSQKPGMIAPAVAGKVKIISLGLFAQGEKAAILRGPMAANVIRQFLTQVDWGELDYLLIDYPPGTGDIQLTLAQTAPITAGIIITTPQEVALIDVRKAVSMFSTLKVPLLGVIETMSYFVCDNCDKKHMIFRQNGGEKIAAEFGAPLLGQIPLEEAVVIGGDEGQPIVLSHPQSASAIAYTNAAQKAAAQISILNSQEAGMTDFEMTWQN